MTDETLEGICRAILGQAASSLHTTFECLTPTQISGASLMEFYYFIWRHGGSVYEAHGDLWDILRTYHVALDREISRAKTLYVESKEGLLQ